MDKLKPFVAFVPGLAVALFNTGLQVSGYQNFGLAVGLWCLAAFLLVLAGLYLAGIWNRGRKENGKMGLEPIHIIAVGLAIAAIGVGWQIWRGNGARIVAPTASAAPSEMPVHIQASTPKPKPHYDSREINEMLGTLRGIDAVIEKRYAPALQNLNDALHGWVDRVSRNSSDTRIDQIRSARGDLVAARAEILGIFRAADFYKDELAALIRAENDGNSSMEGALTGFVTDVDELSRYEGAPMRFANPSLNRLEAVTGEMRKWVEEARPLIKNKTIELREWKNP